MSRAYNVIRNAFIMMLVAFCFVSDALSDPYRSFGVSYSRANLTQTAAKRIGVKPNTNSIDLHYSFPLAGSFIGEIGGSRILFSPTFVPSGATDWVESYSDPLKGISYGHTKPSTNADGGGWNGYCAIGYRIPLSKSNKYFGDISFGHSFISNASIKAGEKGNLSREVVLDREFNGGSYLQGRLGTRMSNSLSIALAYKSYAQSDFSNSLQLSLIIH
jgi:hypothetical protein